MHCLFPQSISEVPLLSLYIVTIIVQISYLCTHISNQKHFIESCFSNQTPSSALCNMLFNETQSVKCHETKPCVSTKKAVSAVVRRREECNQRNVFLQRGFSVSASLTGHLILAQCAAKIYHDQGVCLVLFSRRAVKARQSLAPITTQVLPFPPSEVPPYLFLIISYFREDAHLLITAPKVLLYEEQLLTVTILCPLRFDLGDCAQFGVSFDLNNHASAPINCCLHLSEQENRTIYRHWRIFLTLSTG